MYRYVNSPLKSYECCVNHCRDWSEMRNGMLPPSDHAPSCKHYKTKKYFQVYPKDMKGFNSCIVEDPKQIDEIEECEIKEIEMTEDQYAKLREFEGW